VTQSLHAAGSFDVTITPRAPAEGAMPGPVGIMSLDKQFHGDLEAVSIGEMLASRIESTGAAAYVALERVTGTLAGRTGSFVLAHLGTMTKDSQHLAVTIVPASGTGDLAGISGTLAIRVEGKAHYYEMEYVLSPAVG
jgi:hypothetical protein